MHEAFSHSTVLAVGFGLRVSRTRMARRTLHLVVDRTQAWVGDRTQALAVHTLVSLPSYT